MVCADGKKISLVIKRPTYADEEENNSLNRDGAVVRALVSCQCGTDSNSRHGVICGMSLLVVVVLNLNFSPGSRVFSLQQMNNSKFYSDLETVDEEPICRRATVNSHLFIHFNDKFHS